MARKILFVTHDTSLYGASKSLQALLRSLGGQVECALLVPRQFRRAVDFAALRAQFGVRAVHAEWLPFLDCFVGRVEQPSWRERAWLALSNLLGRIGRRRIAALARREGYEVVHLNSLVLAPLVTEEVPTVVHVRELWDGGYPDVVRRCLEAAAGVVFIDQPVAEPFRGFALRRALVLPNPVLPANRASLPPGKAWLAERVAGKLVLAIIGYVKEEKGIGFLIDCLKAFADPGLVLLVVGEGDMQPACQAHAHQDSRLVCYGPETETDVIYSIVDVVIRAEDAPRMGRTVYEALYAGKAVALPGAESAYPADLLAAHGPRIFFYDIRDVASFTTLLQRLLQAPPQAVPPFHTSYDTVPLLRFWDACAGG